MAPLSPAERTTTESSEKEKGVYKYFEQTPEEQVKALPDGLKTEAGLLIDTEGLASDRSLKVSHDGHTVLLPQPTDRPDDPLNWSWASKHFILLTIAWGALCADFTSAAGSAGIFIQAEQWGITPDQANQPNNINVLMGGLGGLIWVPMSSYWGRAPVLFWSTIAGLAFCIGSAVSPSYECYFVMRALTNLSLTSGQTIAIAFLRDIFFFHERARKIGLWAALYIASPYLGPGLSNFVVYGTGHWQDIYWLSTGVVGLQIVFILAFVDETWYNRDIPNAEQPVRQAGIYGRLMRIMGFWQIKNHKKYFPKALPTCKRFFTTIMKPAFFLICLSYFLVFAWAIGINVSSNILLAEPESAGGYGFTNLAIGYLYFTPIVGTFIGELVGHFFNDYMARRYIHRHNGTFEPEVRLWMIYISIAFMVPALVLVGQALQYHLHITAIIFGWGIFVFGVMTMSVAVTAYALDSFPYVPAEIGGWINFARTFGGFSVGYFQSPWEHHVGAAASFGTQAAVVVIAAVPVVITHVYGRRLRPASGD